MKSIKFAFVQTGYCVWGTGFTKKQSISDARKWLQFPDGVRVRGGLSFNAVKNLLSNQHIDGGFRIISSDDDEFGSYLKNQGGFVKRGSGWYPQK